MLSIHTHTYTYVHTYTYMHTYGNYQHTYIRIKYIHVQIRMCVLACVFAFLFFLTKRWFGLATIGNLHAFTNTRTHTHTHTHGHTHVISMADQKGNAKMAARLTWLGHAGFKLECYKGVTTDKVRVCVCPVCVCWCADVCVYVFRIWTWMYFMRIYVCW